MENPVSTYRLQLTPLFGFANIRELIPYFKRLGISYLYLSPIFKARPGSTHGYDIVDPCVISAELGGEEQFKLLSQEAHSAGIGIIQDIVPNHMAFHYDNKFLMDIFEYGSYSQYYDFFDIDWGHPYDNLRGRVLVPVLGKFYAECLESGELQLVYRDQRLGIQYYNHFFPLKVESYSKVLSRLIPLVEKEDSSLNKDLVKFIGIKHFFESFESIDSKTDRYEQTLYGKQALSDLHARSEFVQKIMSDTLKDFNGAPGDSHSYDSLDELIAEQMFRLSFWKVATEEINYRRFFTVNDLISVRVEERKNFDITHELIIKLYNDNYIDGVRVDHIDGLYDPKIYMQWLRQAMPKAYIVVEKILEGEEKIPSEWPIQGTTGYDFLSQVNMLFCDKENERAISKLYYRYAELRISYEALVCEKKRLIIGKHMAGNVDNLAQYIKKISSHDRFGRDITLYALRRALVELLAHFPIYRTYINSKIYMAQDKEYILNTLKKVKMLRPELRYEFDFIEKFLLLQYDSNQTEEVKDKWLHFVMIFQQQTGPLMAKGLEDTMFYVYNKLISLNEVGGDPIRFGCLSEEFHQFNKQRYASAPLSINTTATHDTKRGEDVRMRISVLSEFADQWEVNLKQWTKMNKAKKNQASNKIIPTSNDEYFLYQTLLGTFPFKFEQNYLDRIKQYSVKAVREAKVHTAWIEPDEEYEREFVSFIEKILVPFEDNPFLSVFIPFQKKIAFFGMLNSLSQVILKMTSPGTPDFYQGTELWDLSLVDPDNRRPVDFKTLDEHIDYIARKIPENILALLQELYSGKEDGRIKLFLIHRLLHFRQKAIKLFQEGEYIPLAVEGEFADCVIAFMRQKNENKTITIAPRFYTKFVEPGGYPFGSGVWKDTRIVLPFQKQCQWEDIITSQKLKAQGGIYLGDVLKYFPVALLSSQKDKV